MVTGHCLLLPRLPETLWLRVLGRERVQQEAIDELEALSEKVVVNM